MAELPADVLEYFKKHGQRGGKKAANMLTADQRSDRAKKAAAKSAEVRSARSKENAKPSYAANRTETVADAQTTPKARKSLSKRSSTR